MDTPVPSDVVSGTGLPPESTPESPESHCEKCTQVAQNEEIAFAFLLALMPVVTLTLFGNMGLL